MAEKKKGFAVPVLRRKRDGQNTVVFADVDTGEIVDPKDYEILDQYSAHLKELGLLPADMDPATETSPEAAKTETKGNSLKTDYGGRGDYYSSRTTNTEREMANNYGYIDKPKLLGFAGALPGPLGLVGKVANAGVNLNNKVAVDKAREVLGLSKSGGFIRGALSDNEGYIGDVSYNGVTSPVGFEATDALGRTTLTPNEARMRQQLSQNFREAQPVEKAQSIAQFNTENPEAVPSKFKELAGTVAKGAIGGLMSGDVMGGVLGSLVNSVRDYGIGVAADAIGKAVNSTTNAASTATTSSQRKGMGLGDLSPSFNEGITYTHPERGPVTSNLSERSVDVLNSLAGASGTGIKVTSAYRSPEVNRAVGGATNSMHITGDAFDLSTKGLNDQEKRDLVERAVMSGAMEIGTYPDQSLHIASRQRMSPTMRVNGVEVEQPTGGVTAMHNRSRHNYNNSPEWFKDGLEVSRLAATPTARPEYSTPMGVRNEAVGTVDLSRANQFDEATRARMAHTLAGEIDSRYTDVNTEEGRREAFGVLSTMENRAGRYGGVVNAINEPAQYSTWNTPNSTRQAMVNYNTNPEMYDNLVNDYLANPSNNLGFTSYYNPSISNPGWDATMVNTENIGPHRFGTLNEYSTFGNNFGQTQMSQVTQEAVQSTKPAVGGLMAEASGTMKLNSTKPDNLSGFSSSVSGENANRSTFSSSPASKTSSYDKSKDESLGGTKTNESKGFSSKSSVSSSKSSNSSYDKSKDSGFSSVKAPTPKTSSYDKSKDSGLGGTKTSTKTPDNKGDSKTSSGRLGGRV